MRPNRTLIGLLAAGLTAGMTVVTLPTAARAAAGDVAFRAAATSTANAATQRVTVPASVQAGDALLLFASEASSAAVSTSPAGWTLVGSRQAGTDLTTRLFSKVATAADAGAATTVVYASTVKGDLNLVAYSGTDTTSPIDASASAAETTSRTTHATPGVAVTANDLVVSFWADKSSATTAWTLPAGQTQRSTIIGSGSGRTSSVSSDSGTPVTAAGTSAALTSTADAASARATMWSIALKKAASAPANQAPVASFTANCSGLTCSVDASASTDADGTVASYAWNFGDGTTATGRTASRTYTAAGSRTITLTVTDNAGTTSAPVTRTVNPQPAPTLPTPGHTGIVPETPRTNYPKISTGEIWDIETIGSNVYIAGSFTSIANNMSGNTTSYNQPYLASYNMDTGLVNANFRPSFSGGVEAVEASPDGTKLFVAGTFNTINGVSRRKVASIDLATGAPITAFNTSGAGNGAGQALAVSNTTVYLGGQFTTINGVNRTGLAALDITTGAVDTSFNLPLSGGIGPNGAMSVQQLKLTHDFKKLMVEHSARQIAGQDRYGIGMIDTVAKTLLPWRTRLWEDNLQYVGGVQRLAGGDISPDDSFFVVSSGSGGDRPPINDTAVAFPVDSASDSVQPKWITRNFDSVYSVGISEKAVYIGGHLSFTESQTSADPYPGLATQSYGNGEGLGPYVFEDQVVRREHIAALDPSNGKALEWRPDSNSYEGNKAMKVTKNGLFTGGDATTQGGYNVGRIAFYDFRTVPAATATETTIETPVTGRIIRSGATWTITGKAKANQGVRKVQIEVISNGRYLQPNLTTWGSATSINATLGTPGADGWTPYSLTLTIPDARALQVTAKAFGNDGSSDATKAIKKVETFSYDDQTPSTGISAPNGIVPNTTFTVSGTATDDKGINSIRLYLYDEQDRYLTADGDLVSSYTSFSIDPDVVGATSATWSREITVPHEGEWTIGASAVDTIGQSDIAEAKRTINVNSTASAPTVTISAPVSVTPPVTAPSFTVTPGQPLTFRGTASDTDGLISSVEISLRNSTTRENLAADGTWGTNVTAGQFRLSPANWLSNPTTNNYSWSYTTPFNLSPGSYSFTVRATDSTGLITANTNQGRLSFTAQAANDAFPNGLLTFTGTDSTTESFNLNITGTATDDLGVASVGLAVLDSDTGKYLQPNGQLATGFTLVPATLASPGATSTTFSAALTLPQAGNYGVTAYAVDTAGQQDPSTTGATARYMVYPGDEPPTLNESLAAPVSNQAFTESRIVVTGRAEDDNQIGNVQVGIVNAAGQYMSTTGGFSAGERWVTAFLTSPGSAGSNYSYTSPVIPAGTYTVRVRATDAHGQVMLVPRDSTGVTVTAPAGNTAPVAAATVSCSANVCSFDARTTTDENPATLTYSWNYGNGRTGSGSVPVFTYTSAGTFTVTLTAKDEYGLTGTTTLPVTITEPAGNVAPAPVITSPSCSLLVCNFSGVQSADPNTGDTFTYLWNFGDGTATSTSSAPSHTFPAAGTYTVTLTTTDGWGKAASTTRTVTVSAT